MLPLFNSRNNYKYPVSKTVQWSMWQSRCVSKTCRALLQVTDGERKSPPARRKKELSSTIKLDVSLLSQHFFFFCLFCFCFFGYSSPRKLCVSLRVVYLARSSPWNNTTLQRVKTRGKQRKKVDRKEAESPEFNCLRDGHFGVQLVVTSTQIMCRSFLRFSCVILII